MQKFEADLDASTSRAVNGMPGATVAVVNKQGKPAPHTEARSKFF
jgi:hypothetical protein